MRSALTYMLVVVFAVCVLSDTAECHPDHGSPSTEWFDEAIDQAVKERQYLIVVMVDDSEESRKFVAESIASAGVQKWIKHRANVVTAGDHGIALKPAMNRLQVATLPSLVVFASDGSELGRLTGFADAARVYARLNAVVQSDEIRGAPGIHGWKGEDVLLQLMDVASKKTDEGSFAEAQELLVWCLNHRVARSPIFPIQHLENLMRGMIRLGKKHEPMMTKLEERIAAAEAVSLQVNRPQVFEYYIIRYGHSLLNREDRLLDFYDRLKKRFPYTNCVAAFRSLIYAPLLNARRYEDLETTVADPDNVDVFLNEARQSKRPVEEVHHLMSGRYEILLGLGMRDQARSLAQKILTYDKSPGAYLALAEGALRSGRSADVNIQQAQNAYLMTDGKVARSVMVLARLMAQKTPKDKDAIALVRKALKEEFSQEDIHALTKCLYDIQSGKVPPRRQIDAQVRKRNQ